jgi:DNA-binding transcriptional MerR regulator
MADQLMTIGELARRTGVAPSALRYYEELGLLPPACRTAGQRRYDASAVDRVGMILLLRDVGFSLSEMKALMAARSQSLDAWRELARIKLAELDERIARAQAARTALQHGLRCEHVDFFDCPNFTRVLAARMAGQSLEEAHRH